MMIWCWRRPLAPALAIVTGDDDLLVLSNYSGIEICTPRRFLEQLDAEWP